MADDANRLFELRIYTANEGKMADLHKRFREHTNKLFEKHGMTLVGYWTPTEGPDAANTLIYFLAYPSKEAADKSWKEFRADPDWVKAKDAETAVADYAERHGEDRSRLMAVPYDD